MAASADVTDGECECPICGDYSGEPSSVEAHISRKTDEAHQGEVGRQYRNELIGAASSNDAPPIDEDESAQLEDERLAVVNSDDEDDADGLEDGDGGGDGDEDDADDLEDEDGGVQEERDEDDGDGDGDGENEDVQEGRDDADGLEDGETDEGGVGGVPTGFVVIVTVFLGVVLYVRLNGGDDADEAAEDEEDDETTVGELWNDR